MPKAITWFIINIRSGRELFLHELFAKAGFKVYTPFERKFQRPISNQSRGKRAAPQVYAEALFKGFLFVGSDLSRGEALLGCQYIIDRRDDVYHVLAHMGEPMALSECMMGQWRAILDETHAKRKTYVIRGYDPRKDARKNKTRLYGQEAITMPTFTKGEQVKFMSGSFTGLTAEVSEVNGEIISVLMTIFGQRREVKDVDVYELLKTG